MKTMKKLASLLLALAMIFSLATAAFAEDEGTTPTKNDRITVTSAKAGETYDLYQLFDLVVDDEYSPTGFSYKVNSAWANFFAAGGAGAQYITLSGTNVINISDPAALAKAAAEWTNKPAASQSVTVAENENTAVFSGLADGYWLITSTLGTVAMTRTTPADSDVTVNEKNPEDSIEKKVKEDSTGTFGGSNDAQVGDTVEFKSTVKIVKGTRNVVVHDKMDSGLTYTAGSVTIEGLTKGTEYTVNENPGHDDTFDITFDQAWIDGLDFGTDGYKEYVITYDATLNEKAAQTTTVEGENTTTTGALNAQKNTTKITYGNNQSVNSETTTTTHKFSVYKHATGATDNLAGATFKLKKAGTVVKLIMIDDKNYRVAKAGEAGAVDTFTTVASGDIVIWGVDADNDYKLEETEAPTGYNKLAAEVGVTVDAANGTRVDVENKFGTELPSTGGMGTTLFYVVGGILVAAAAVLLVTKKRMAN